MKNLVIYFLFIYFTSFGQITTILKPDSNSKFKTIKLTPFNTKGNYQTFAIQLRLLPWIIGDDKGYNALAGIQIGLLNHHSFSVAIMKGYSNKNIDAYSRNDSLIQPNRVRNESTIELHFAYNYHLKFETLRRNYGLSFYAGLNYRIGSRQLVSDTGMYIGDYTLRAKRQYYSFGPQVGAFWNIGNSKLFALNLNITPYYCTKTVETIEARGNINSTHFSNFKTIDLRIGFNLIVWIKYHNRTAY